MNSNELERKIFRETKVQRLLINDLEKNGWDIEEGFPTKSGKVDIRAEKERGVMFIEAKGEDKGGYGSAEMNFQIGIGQIVSRMFSDDYIYALAVPYTEDFLKVLKKYGGTNGFEKLRLNVFLVNEDGKVEFFPAEKIKSFIESLNIEMTIKNNEELEESGKGKKIKNDEELEKIRNEGKGFIYNDFSKNRKDGIFYNILHRAGCGTLSGSRVTKDYNKYYYSTMEDAENSLIQYRGSNWKKCGTCLRDYA